MNHKNFDWGYFLKHIAIIAVPVALQNLLTTTGSMVDTIMLASIGEKAVGAVGLCAQFSSLMFAGYWGLRGLTQAELAEATNLSRTHISNIEAPNGKTSISLNKLFDIADVLEVPVKDLFDFRDT